MMAGNNIVNFLRNCSWQAKAIIFGGGFFVLVIIVITIASLNVPKFESDNHVTIVDYSEEISDVPEEFLENAQYVIWEALKNSLDLSGTTYADAAVREGTYVEEEIGEVTHVKMIVDIESVKQSAKIELAYNKSTTKKYEDLDVGVSCPDPEDVIYTDTKCAITSPLTQLSSYLPKELYINNGTTKLKLVLQKFAGESRLEIELEVCGNESLRGEAMTAVKKWLKSVYLDPNDYKIETYDVCGR